MLSRCLQQMRCESLRKIKQLSEGRNIRSLCFFWRTRVDSSRLCVICLIVSSCAVTSSCKVSGFVISMKLKNTFMKRADLYQCIVLCPHPFCGFFFPIHKLYRRLHVLSLRLAKSKSKNCKFLIHLQSQKPFTHSKGEFCVAQVSGCLAVGSCRLCKKV